MKKRESLSGQIVAANLLLVVAALFAASAASSLDLRITDERFEFALLAMTVILALLLNILMLQRRFSPLDELIREIEAIDPSNPSAFEAPEEPVEEVERLAHAFANLLERIEAERRRAGRLQLRAQEEERKRVARDLHDEVNQALTAILLRLEALTHIAPPRLREELAETKALANQAMGELLQLARQLRPTALDDHGFVPAIEDQLRRFKAQYGIDTSLSTERRARRPRERPAARPLPRDAGGAQQRRAPRAGAAASRWKSSAWTAASRSRSRTTAPGSCWTAGTAGSGSRAWRSVHASSTGSSTSMSTPGRGTTLKLRVPA